MVANEGPKICKLEKIKNNWADQTVHIFMSAIIERYQSAVRSEGTGNEGVSYLRLSEKDSMEE